MTRLVLEQAETLQLDASPQAVLAACRRAFFDLGWEILDADEARLVAMEVPVRLGCLERPAVIAVRVRANSPMGATATLAASVHGIGRRASRQLSAKLELVQKRFLARLG